MRERKKEKKEREREKEKKIDRIVMHNKDYSKLLNIIIVKA